MKVRDLLKLLDCERSGGNRVYVFPKHILENGEEIDTPDYGDCAPSRDKYEVGDLADCYGDLEIIRWYINCGDVCIIANAKEAA